MTTIKIFMTTKEVKKMDNAYKVPKGTSFKEFYYQGLSINNSGELAAYIKSNKWYFEKMTLEIQEQFRKFWLSLKKQEEQESEEYK